MATNIEESRKFYDATLGVLGVKPGLKHIGHGGVVRYMYFLEGVTFLISEPLDGNPAGLPSKGSDIKKVTPSRKYMYLTTPPCPMCFKPGLTPSTPRVAS